MISITTRSTQWNNPGVRIGHSCNPLETIDFYSLFSASPTLCPTRLTGIWQTSQVEAAPYHADARNVRKRHPRGRIGTAGCRNAGSANMPARPPRETPRGVNSCSNKERDQAGTAVRPQTVTVVRDVG